MCIRVRPLLTPFEDEEVWGVDLNENKIQSLNMNLASSIDPMAMVMNQINSATANATSHMPVNINAFIREKELRRRYQDAMQTQSF